MKLNYQHHIDGLRAIAVSLVVFYHAGFSSFAGGFIGVDIFFVLSGFLITGQIIDHMSAGSFSLKQFYTRRLRRLAPAFFLVCAVCLLLGLRLLAPEDLELNAKLVALTFIPLANFYLANKTGGYFAADTDEITFLHTWSLVVEEQYYLIWPLLLFLIFRIGRENMRLVAMSGLLLAAVVFSAWFSSEDATRAYYLLPARFHELLIGGMLAAGLPHLARLSERWADGLSVIAIGAIVVSVYAFDATLSFPGYYALIPCLATAALVYTGMCGGVVKSILGSAGFVAIGKISYSLYLWHWPIFSYMHYATGDIPFSWAMAGIVASVALSYATWRFVEQPVRFRYKLSPRQLFFGFYVLPIALVAVLLTAIDQEGANVRFGEQAQAVQTLNSPTEKPPKECLLPADSPYCADILLVGDSHAYHLTEFTQVLAEDMQLTLHRKWHAACLPLLGITPVDLHEKDQPLDHECRIANEEALADPSQYRYVVLSGLWSLTEVKPEYFLLDGEASELDKAKSLEALEQGLRRSLTAISSTGAQPIIAKDIPYIGNSLFRCVRMRALFDSYDKNCSMSLNEVQSQQRSIDKIFSKMAGEFETLRFIEPNRILCQNGECVTEMSGLPLFRDEDHLNGVASKMLGEQYLSSQPNPFAH